MIEKRIRGDRRRLWVQASYVVIKKCPVTSLPKWRRRLPWLRFSVIHIKPQILSVLLHRDNFKTCRFRPIHPNFWPPVLSTIFLIIPKYLTLYPRFYCVQSLSVYKIIHCFWSFKKLSTLSTGRILQFSWFFNISPHCIHFVHIHFLKFYPYILQFLPVFSR